MQNSLNIIMPKDFSVEEAADFRLRINQYMNDGIVNFNFNFTECTFIDSTGLGVLVSIYKKCVEKNGKIKLLSLNPEVKKLFKLTRLDRIFEME